MNIITYYMKYRNIANDNLMTIRDAIKNKLGDEYEILYSTTDMGSNAKELYVCRKGTLISTFIYNDKSYNGLYSKHKLSIGDQYFFKTSNIDGDELVPFECPYWKEHKNHKGSCNLDVPYSLFEDQGYYDNCDNCSYFQEWLGIRDSAVTEEINSELMKIVFLCICEYKYSGLLFKPVNFVLESEDYPNGNRGYYCSETDEKVAVIYQTDSINKNDLIKVVEAHERIRTASEIYYQGNLEVLKLYGLDDIPDDYIDRTNKYLNKNKKFIKNFQITDH